MAFVALLDANAIWSAAVRDTLLRAARDNLYRPVWSREILGGMARSLKEKRPDLEPAKIDRLVERMLDAFPHALVECYQDLIPAMWRVKGAGPVV